MAKARFVPNFKGYRDVLDSAGVQGLCRDLASQTADKAVSMMDPDEGYNYEDYVVGEFPIKTGSTGYFVRTKTDHARYSQAKNKTLTKALKSVI